MQYSKDVLDRKTGTLVSVDLGDWITLTELGTLFGAGPKTTRAVLREMDFVQVETRGRHSRHRLCRWVVDRGWGRRLDARGRVPFDVVGPEAQSWVIERWSACTDAIARRAASGAVLEAINSLAAFKATRWRDNMSTQGDFLWLRDHFPGLSQPQLANILEVTQQLVSRFSNARDRQRAKWSAFKLQELHWFEGTPHVGEEVGPPPGHPEDTVVAA